MPCQFQHVGSSSPTKDRTWDPCIGSRSLSLDNQGSPRCLDLADELGETNIQVQQMEKGHVFPSGGNSGCNQVRGDRMLEGVPV